MPIFLNHTEGGKTGQIESFDKDQIRIGRQSDNDLRFDPKADLSVSGYHAEIYRDSEKYFIKDLQSRNGTFVNARRIDGPVALKEGDTIQFSSRGPKVIFSTRDPSLPAAPAATAVGAATEVFAAEGSKAPEPKPGIWQKIKSRSLIAAIAVAFTALAGFGFYIGWPWWQYMISGAVALLVTAGVYFTSRLWKRRRTLVEQQKKAHEEREASLGRGDKSNLQDLRRKWTEVIQSLKSSKLQRSGDDPIYAFPWFLVIGESGCGKSALVKSGGALSSILTPGGEGPTRNCDWWFFNKVVVLDTSGRYVFQAKESEAHGEWQTLLGQLGTHRRSEPINGVIVTLAADALASRPIDKLKEQAAQVRERLDEMTQLLGVNFPVYLVVSKCDLIPGFNEFFDALPEPVRGQALGYVNPDPINHSDASGFFDRAFRTIVDRLGSLRLAVLSEAERPEAAHGAFLFPAELKTLQGPMKAWIDIIFRPSPYHEAPFFRGLFLTSVRRAGSPVSRLSRMLASNYNPAPSLAARHEVFARDLFSTALPNDRALVGHTALSRERHRTTRTAGLVAAVAASLLLCGLFSMSFKNNWTALRESNFTPCIRPGKSNSIVGNLAATDECRRLIENYEPKTVWQRTAMNFGLAQWPRLGDKLRERFSTLFAATVLEPLNINIDRRLSSGSASPLLLGAIFQRIQLLAACHDDSRCSFGENSKDVNYAVLLSTIDSQIKEGHPTVSIFRRDYQSFLLWQGDQNAYERMKSKDQERVERWIRSGGLSNEGILTAANELFSPIRAADFWDVASPSQVQGAYTLNAWSKGIEPLLAALKQITERTDKTKYEYDVREFEAKYKRATIQEWGEFLARFVEEQPRTLPGARRLALTLIDAKSPYQAVLHSANQNLTGILGRSAGEQELPGWVNLLKAYGELKESLAKPPKEGKADDKSTDNETLGYLTVYLEALKRLPTKLSTPQDSFVAAQDAFREGEAAGKPTQPVLQAYWAVKMLKSTERFKYRDPVFWIFLERPIDVAWKSILDEAGTHLQQQWRQVYLATSGDEVTPSIKAAKVIEFVNAQGVGFLKPQRNGYQVNTVQGQGIRFTPQFMALISTLGPSSLSGSSRLPERIVRN